MDIQGSLEFLPSNNLSEFCTNLQMAPKNTSFEESNLKCLSQIEEGIVSQQKKSRVFWTEEEKKVLRKVVYDYKTSQPESAPLKWSIITGLFNQTMQEKGVKSTKNRKNLTERWNNHEASDLIRGRILKEHKRSLSQLIFYFSCKNNKETISWAVLRDFIKEHNVGYYYSSNTLKNFSNSPDNKKWGEELFNGTGEISDDEAVTIAKSLQLQSKPAEDEEKCTNLVESAKTRPVKKRALQGENLPNHRVQSVELPISEICKNRKIVQKNTSCEESALKSSSQIDAVRSQHKKSRVFWTEQEKTVLRKVVYDYQTSQPESAPLKWSIITGLFNQIMQETGVKSTKNRKNLTERWNNHEASDLIRGRILKEHKRSLSQLIFYFSCKNNKETISWAALRDFIKEHNGGYYYSDNALKNFSSSSDNKKFGELFNGTVEISDDEAVTIAKSLQLQQESLENEEQCMNIVGSAKTSPLKENALGRSCLSEELLLDEFVFDPDFLLFI